MTGEHDEPGSDQPGWQGWWGPAAAGGQPADAADLRPARLTAWVAGQVQGVGFRWWVRSRALELGLAGVAENLEDGRVRVVAEGVRDRCAALLALLSGPGTPGRVSRVTHRWDAPTGRLSGFIERLQNVFAGRRPSAADPAGGERQRTGPPVNWEFVNLTG